MPGCNQCGKEFATETALAQHLRDRHGVADIVASSGTQESAGSSKPGKRQKSLRRRNRHPVAIGLAAAAIVVALALYLVVTPSLAQPPYPCIAEQSYYIHVHPYLQIWVDGKNVTIPSQVGITQGGSCLEPIHTHDASGILHVELSQDQSDRNWTLGDFFTIWKYTCGLQAAQCPAINGTTRPVIFNQTDVLGFKADSTHKVVLLVDGVPSGDLSNLNLEKLAYCSAANSNSPPCNPTAGGNPAWECLSTGQCGTYPYTTGNKIVIEYVHT